MRINKNLTIIQLFMLMTFLPSCSCGNKEKVINREENKTMMIYKWFSVKGGVSPRSGQERGLPFDRNQNQRRALLEAFRGLILAFLVSVAALT